MTSLTGKRILVTRPRAQAEGLVDQLAELGAVPVVFPTIEIAPPEDASRLDRAIGRLAEYAWVIFTSVNGVAAFWERVTGLGMEAAVQEELRAAAIGPATAGVLAAHGVTAAFVPGEYVAEAILPGLGDVSGKRILLPRAEIARKALFDALVKAGAMPEEIAVYRTLPGKPDEAAWAELERGVDAVTFTSSSTVRNFAALVGENAGALLGEAVVACIGPITAGTARECGWRVDVVAEEDTMEGLVRALKAYYDLQ
jgi:uroporphyrinogen-III synthase